MVRGIKTFIKYSLGKWCGAEEHKIQDLIRQAEVVSFDIFDTLVKRDVGEPEHVHKLVEEEFFRRTGIRLEGYPLKRVDAEKKARECSNKEEISLREIYRCLEGVPEKRKGTLLQIEEETEIGICCPDLRMKRLYGQILKGKKHIVITSDMYLREEVIRKILKKCGYKGYEKLYLSSTYHLCKSTGNLYEVIKKDYPEYGGRILHIGDNLKGDYLRAKEKGIRGCLIDGRKENLTYWKKGGGTDFDYEKLYCFLNNRRRVRDCDAAVIGYEILGPMLLGYCRWLREKIEKDGIEKIFFLSREGKILQEAFNILYPGYPVTQCYLYVSRQALTVPLIADAGNFDEMMERIKCFFHVPLLKTVRIVCSLEKDEFCRELTEIGVGEDTKIYEVPEDKKEAVFSIIKKLGGTRFEGQKRLVTKYLKENGFVGKVAIADIGWVGTMQEALGKFIPDAEIHGYYFGVRDLYEKYENSLSGNIRRNGYLFEPGKNSDFDLMVRFTTEIFELMFLCRDGSVRAYGEKKGEITAEFEKAEYGGKEGEFIGVLQKSALGLLEIIGGNKECRDRINVKPEAVMKAYAGFAVYPKRKTIRIFKEFVFFDGRVRRLLPDHSFFYYCFHLKELKKAISDSQCKIFFFKSLFEISLPYYKLLRFLTVKMNLKSDYRKRFYS